MICTFGDTTDVTWWRELQLPTRPIIGWDGRITTEVPDWITSDLGKSAYAALAGLTAHSAKEKIAELLELFHFPDLVALVTIENAPVGTHIRGQEQYDNVPGTIGVYLPVVE